MNNGNGINGIGVQTADKAIDKPMATGKGNGGARIVHEWGWTKIAGSVRDGHWDGVTLVQGVVAYWQSVPHDGVSYQRTLWVGARL